MTERFIFIGIGTALMLLLSLLRKKQYNLPWWKAVAIPFVLTIFGVAGAMILAFIENGRWGGISFYGSVLLIPALLILAAIFLKIPYGELTDFSVPQICLMLAVMKVHCFVSGCCGGICLYTPEVGDPVYFPSQIVESILALAMAAFILYLDSQKLFKGRLYGVYFLAYGILRFALNFLRIGIKPFVWFIPAGHFWSLISIGLGIAWILLLKPKVVQETESEDQSTDV